MIMVRFDRKEYLRLKRAYNKAVQNNQETFTFKRTILLTSYIKYLIEYLDSYYEN